MRFASARIKLKGSIGQLMSLVRKLNMKQAVAAILVLIALVCSLGRAQEFLDQTEIDRIADVIDHNELYPPLPSNEQLAKKSLVFGLIMSFGGNIDSSGAVPGVRVALDRINNDTSLLPGYTLHYALSDSRCHRPQAIRALFKQVPYSDPKRIALIGGGCSVASEPTAEISHHFNIMQISCVTATPVLSDRVRFPSYFQFLPSMVDFAPAYFGIIREFNWRHVVILLQDENLYTLTIDKLKDLLDKENITYSIDLFYSKEGLNSLDREPFSNPDERIYIIASYAPYARELLCEAYHLGIRYPTHLLVTYHWYSPQWWLVEDQNYTCTGEQRGEVLHRMLSVTIFNTSYVDREQYNTSMNITGEEFREEEDRLLGEPPFNFSRSSFARYCHDATWALAWSLHKTIQNESLDPSQVDYQNSTFTNVILQHMNSSFTGLTGNIKFNEHGVRRAERLLVFQFRKDGGSISSVEIGSVVMQNNGHIFKYLPDESRDTLWPNKLEPYDGVPNTVIDKVATPLVVVIDLLAVAGMVFAVICLVFNFVYRKTRIMQISRPRLNYLIILGAFLFYVTMILIAIPTTDENIFLGLFKTIPWTMALGFSLCYGTIIMKMFRVYYIVNNPLPNKNIEDWVLALGVLVFVIIDIVLLFLNTTITESLGLFTATLMPNRDNPRTVTGDLHVSTDHTIYFLDSQVQRIFTAILFGYKGILQLIALLLAFRTRNIKVKGLDDAKFIISTVYITTIGIVIIAMTFYVLREYLLVYTATVSLALFFTTVVILGLVFIPKMVALYKDPKGEKIFGKFETPSFKSQQGTVTESTIGTTDSALRKRIVELENILATNQMNGTTAPNDRMSADCTCVCHNGTKVTLPPLP